MRNTTCQGVFSWHALSSGDGFAGCQRGTTGSQLVARSVCAA